MKNLLLERYAYGPESVDGRLYLIKKDSAHGTINQLLAYTTELPWRDNLPGISAIPDGFYDVQPFVRSSGESAFILLGNGCGTLEQYNAGRCERWGILFHAGNVASKDSQGCILPGLGYSSGAVVQSRKAMQKIAGALAPETSMAGSNIFISIRQQHPPADIT